MIRPSSRVHRSPISGLVSGYGRERQLGPYAALLTTYATATAVGVLTGVRRRRATRPPTFADGALLAIAAFKLSRLVTKDKVSGVVRAPFTEFVEEGDGAEINEAPRGDGLRYAIGELLTCPFCFNQWAATALGVAWLHAPRATRDFNTLLTASAAADVLHVAWTKIESQA
ncbi:MAG: DUF1360 domain-containing protein [Candidatus Dormibacteraeota bacterium]|nr:DUF1360 domain-containing protein [Candidatus Dormibacteraeota bacterium]